ncbi:MAG: RNA 2',3'-cyclic phosphodiesterase [Pseudomonadota bacterium]
MRLFAALSLPETAAERLIALQSGLPVGRIVPPENLHLTLCFFDEIEGNAVDDLHFALDGIRAKRFDYCLDGIGGFGDPRLRQIHATVQNSDALRHLHEKVAAAARRTGVVLPHRRYVPHVTLARLSAAEGRASGRLAKWMAAGADILIGPIRADRFQLYRSTLGPSGPVYAQMASYPLNEQVQA